jgi:hypothetical protein
MDLLASLAALALASVHLLADRVHTATGRWRNRWLSFAGGSSVAFVFLHLLPDMHAAQHALHQQSEGILGAVRHHVYLAGLIGLVVYYSIEHAALRRTRRNPQQGGAEEATEGFFWGHVALFALFNLLVGYLLHETAADEGRLSFVVLAGALILHFLTNDFALRDHHPDDFHRFGRWILALAVLLGWGLGLWQPLHHAVPSLFLGFVAGGIMLNALKEELPRERRGDIAAFALGAAVYAALMLLA